ncbi:MAG TPA: hypothetical protein VJT15_14490 [Pyrinomonadaceae bacterium]|nr:hypothetical protein [Pyrinomonadaceae bacterium]
MKTEWPPRAENQVRMKEAGSLKNGPRLESGPALASTGASAVTSLAGPGITAPAKSKERLVGALVLTYQPRQVELGLNERIARSRDWKENQEEGLGIVESSN